MARIRTVKPAFFRHELLQELEISYPGAYCMLVFEALWGHADANGVFPWQPRQLKLDILPFLPFDMATTLDILKTSGFIDQYEVDGKAYGLIPTFLKHQRLTGKEAENGQRYPIPNQGSTWEAPGKHLGSTGEILESQEVGKRNWERGIGKEERNLLEEEGLGGETTPPPPPPEGERTTTSVVLVSEPFFDPDDFEDPRCYRPVKIWLQGGSSYVINHEMMCMLQNRFPGLDIQSECEAFERYCRQPGKKPRPSTMESSLISWLKCLSVRENHPATQEPDWEV